MARKKLIAGNWKMYTTRAIARELAEGVVKGLGSEERVHVAVCPPFPWLTSVAEVVRDSKVILGAQDVHFGAEGPYTGEVSPPMLLDAGCQCTIVGHSERRHVVNEPDFVLNRKLRSALDFGLRAIFCIGETWAEREIRRTESVLDFQLSAGLAGLSDQQASHLVVAYEPVWAIGTGKTPTLDEIQETHTFIRSLIAKRFNPEIAAALVITYGGSVKPDNAPGILKLPDVDGALVGGASLKASSFLDIVRAAV